MHEKNEKINKICEAGLEKKAEDILIMDMRQGSSICDFFILMSASSTVRAKAIVDSIESSLKNAGVRLILKEGYQEGSWVLMDYGDIIVHIFYHETRRFYNLEHLWGDFPKKNYP